MKKNRLRLICLLAIFILLFAGCKEVKEDPVVIVQAEDNTMSFNLIYASYDTVSRTEKLDCKYVQTKEQEVSFNSTGKYVDKVYVKKGDVVKKGDLLCELSADALKQSIDKLEYTVRRNEFKLGYLDDHEYLDIQDQWINAMRFNTDEATVKESVKSIQENYDRQRTLLNDTLEFDREELNSLKQEYKDSKLYSTLDGKVYTIDSELEGSTSKAGEVIMTIVANENCLFEVDGTEGRDLFSEGVAVNMKVSFSNAAGDYLLMPYDMEKWEDSMLFYVYDGPDTGDIEVGTKGTISIVSDEREHVLCVPKNVLHSAEEKTYVYILNDANIREIRYIETGLYGDDKVEVLSGLQEGEKVIRK